MSGRVVLLFCFFMSGAAGLVYQILWIRMLSLVFGNTVYAVSMVVAAFLSGLALGSHFLGKRADRMKNPLAAYVGLEVGIAVLAVTVTGLIYLADDAIVRVMTVESINSGGWILFRFVVMFALLVGPTFLMGGTLPVMGKLYVPSFEKVGAGMGAIYAANTYGGMAGAFFSGFAMVPLLGMRGSFAAAVVLNLAAAFGVWAAGRGPAVEAGDVRQKKSTPRPRGKKKKKEESAVSGAAGAHGAAIPASLALALFAVSGFVSLSFEVLWTRAFVVSFKSTVYLFSNLLTVFLFGMALGSHVVSRRLDGMRDPVKIFGLTQVGVGLFGMVSVLFFHLAPDMAVSLGRSFGQMDWARNILVMLTLMGMVFILPTFLMGVAYPLICRITIQSLGSLGRDAGLAYAVGTAGGIAGSLAAGFLLLPALGLQNGVFLVSVAALIAGYAAIANSAGRRQMSYVFPASAAPALLIIGGVAISGINVGLGPQAPGEVVFAEEGVMGTVRVTRENKNGPLTLMVNNYQLATSGDVAVRFGHVPLLLKPEAKDVLLISLGSGITAGSVGGHPVEKIECVEIVPTLLDAQSFFKKDNHNIVSDRRFHLTFWDGRHYTRVTERKYDLVISDLFQPDSAGVGSLYSLQHFRNVKEKLKRGGAMAQWLPLYQLSPDNLKVIMRTFAEAFENVAVWYGDLNSRLPTLMLLGSADPILINPAKLAERLAAEPVREDMIESADPLSFLSFYVTDREGVMDFTAAAPVNTDNNPVIEYTAPRAVFKRDEYAVRNFASLIGERKKVTALIPGAAADPELRAAVDRYYRGRTMLLEGKAYHAVREYPAELESYEKAAELIPGDPFLGFALFDMAYLYYHRRDYRKSAELFEWARSVNPRLLEAHFYLAKAYQRMGMTEKASAAFEDLARLRPDIADSLIEQ
ncbi:MAG: fused MFS/spermidine synthase [Candidatus Nitrospinota bacterium M3_3B_026]